MGYDDRCNISALIGKTLKSVDKEDNDRLLFTTTDGEKFLMFHSQDCCEGVSIDDIAGDLLDLVGEPILRAEEAVSDKPPEGVKLDYEPESQTWTFYKLATRKGYVDIRWFGSSNGYYSESVDFERMR